MAVTPTAAAAALAAAVRLFCERGRVVVGVRSFFGARRDGRLPYLGRRLRQQMLEL